MECILGERIQSWQRTDLTNIVVHVCTTQVTKKYMYIEKSASYRLTLPTYRMANVWEQPT